MSEHKVYELKAIGDLLEIPESSFDNFLVDLKKWHKAARSTKHLLDTIGHLVGEKQPVELAYMRWVDDGKHEGKVVITVSEPPKTKTAIYEMKYYALTKCDPYSAQAGDICQVVADNAKQCGYPGCGGGVVGAAVHETIIVDKDSQGRSIYHDGCQFLPVCKKHKAWEFEKVNPNNERGWSWE